MATQTIPVSQETTKVTSRTYANPFSEFRHEMDGLFDKFFAHKQAFDFGVPITADIVTKPGLKTGLIVPDIDIRETKNNFWLRAELPGLTEKDIEIKLRDGVLTLEGEKKFEKDWDQENVRVVECEYGKFQRSFTLPVWVDQEKITAKFESGVLTVFMPKVPDRKSAEKRIIIS